MSRKHHAGYDMLLQIEIIFCGLSKEKTPVMAVAELCQGYGASRDTGYLAAVIQR